MVKPSVSWNDEQWASLIAQIQQHFNDVTIKRGFQYFKQGRVHPIAMSDPNHIEALVDGGDMYRVSIHLDDFTQNRCACPVRTYCKHMIAVLLHHADEQELSVFEIVNAKSSSMLPQTSKLATDSVQTRKQISLSVQTEKDFKDYQQQAQQLSVKSIAEWHALFHTVTASLHKHTKNAMYVNDVLSLLHRLKPELPVDMHTLFDLHIRLFALEKLVKQPEATWYDSRFLMGYHTHVAADDLQDTILPLIQKKIDIDPRSAWGQRLNETIQHIRQLMCTEASDQRYFFHIYEQLWLHWVYPYQQDPSMYSDELQALDEAKQQLGDRMPKVAYLLAQALMHYALSEDEIAWTLLQDQGEKLTLHLDHITPILDAIARTEAWDRLQGWLIHITPLLCNYRNHKLHLYMNYWNQILEHQPDQEPYFLQTLIDMLPFSKKLYEEALLARGHWQRWMDYQLSSGKEPLEFRATELQPLEKHAPHVLLPFYHQAVERYIRQKNRDSYKAAVKLLKRLAKLYKKTKQEILWEQFIDAFTERHSRLRALQEELQKGKLLS